MQSETSRFFASLALFEGLSPEEIDELSWTARPFHLQPGEPLCRQGAPADEMFAIREGKVDLSIRLAGSGQTEIGSLGPGSILGETALVDKGVRTATAMATEPTHGVALHGKAFEVLRAAYRPGAAKVVRRLSGIISDRIASSNLSVEEKPPDGECPDLAPFRTPADDLDVENLARLPVMKEFQRDEIKELLRSCTKLVVPRGTVLFRAGDSPDACYLTVRGAVEICVQSDGRKVKLALQGPGTMFGEAGLFSRRRRSATGWAREKSILLEIEVSTFDRLFREQSIVAYKFFDAAVVLLVQLMRRAIARKAWLETERRGLFS